MPGYDGTGPMGRGPMTGRGYGPCGFGFGWRRQFGMGRGLGRYFNWQMPVDESEEKQALSEYKKALEEELEDVKKQLEAKNKRKED